MPERLEDAEDETLVVLVRAGDERAARVLFSRHEPLLKARARRFVGGIGRKVGASDVLQEAFLAAFQGLEGFEDQGPGSFRRWLESILNHKAADLVKRHVGAGRRSAKREVSASNVTPPRAADPSPSAAAASEEERAALRRAVEALEGDDRTVLDLVHLQGRDFAAASIAMRRSPEAVRKLYGRAVLRLGRSMRRDP
jgi:RNA polymerase sigma-70 factor (ECF subfamily)